MEYFITFTDDYSRYRYIYLLKYKSKAVEKFKEFKLEVENQMGRLIKNSNNDRGGEYEAFNQFCKKWELDTYTLCPISHNKVELQKEETGLSWT